MSGSSELFVSGFGSSTCPKDSPMQIEFSGLNEIRMALMNIQEVRILIVT
jgi:hypothetical protein